MSQDEWAGELAFFRQDASRSFAEAGYAPPRVVLDPSFAAVRHPHLQFLDAFWRAISGGGSLPRARDLSLENIEAALGSVNVVDVVDGGGDFVYAHYGASRILAHGRDLRGVRLSEAPLARPVRAFFQRSYRFAMAARRPVMTDFHNSPGPEAPPLRRLILPMVDDAGAICRFIVAGTSVSAFEEARAAEAEGQYFVGYTDPADHGIGLPCRLPAACGIPAADVAHSFLRLGSLRPDAFTLQEHWFMLHYWLGSIRPGRSLPPSKDIALDDLADVRRNVLLFEPTSDGTDFHYLFTGEEILRANGLARMAGSMRAAALPEVSTFLVQNRAVMINRVGLYAEHSARAAGLGDVRWCRLVLPFENEEGRVDRLLVGCVFEQIPRFERAAE